MQILNEHDYELFKKICGSTQESLRQTLTSFLRSKYDETIITSKYILAKGDIPIALIAHLDTVFTIPAEEIYYDREKNVIWSPDGLGADDRAGVFSIIQIIKKGYRPHIIFTTDEERGAIGASELAKIPCPFGDLRFIIELDRRGKNDCVFYSCNNLDFIDYIEGYGFVEAIGTFSDISVLMGAWGVAGVNLSIGYKNEHSVSEILVVHHMLNTIARVCLILISKDIPKFVYVPIDLDNLSRAWLEISDKESALCECLFCKKIYEKNDLIPIVSASGKEVYFCIDCAVNFVDWCEKCGEAYVKDENFDGLCGSCRHEIK